ncbi:hypothetical protein E2562_031693 [Oryza meyeriana var. granulata]|uniref:Uncharacterized protein n=1 Tax=Oryza meyeriana var. granulata TaxID=110450 RepID=A0A6G1E533_9ORYZ|nr:hypothetical protein E2562_031693 [Oryza meyeriana var. granulata]
MSVAGDSGCRQDAKMLDVLTPPATLSSSRRYRHLLTFTITTLSRACSLRPSPLPSLELLMPSIPGAAKQGAACPRCRLIYSIGKRDNTSRDINACMERHTSLIKMLSTRDAEVLFVFPRCHSSTSS